MNSRSIRVVALAIAIVTLVLCSLPAISFAADKATEIASRSMVTANDMQIASRGTGATTSRHVPVATTGRHVPVATTGRHVPVATTGRHVPVATTGRAS